MKLMDNKDENVFILGKLGINLIDLVYSGLYNQIRHWEKNI